MHNNELLRRGVEQLGISVDTQKQQQLLEYLELLKKWNKVYNLTAIRDPKQMVSNHLLDSLAVVPHLWQGSWLDVGCGAGLPGIVMAIAQPGWQIDMLDSNSKKTGFVQQAVIELGIKNVQVHCARVEEWQPVKKFNGIISRAFTELGQFFDVTAHLMASDGHWAAMKGSPEQEMAELKVGYEIERVIRLQVPGLDAARSLIIAKRTGGVAT